MWKKSPLVILCTFLLALLLLFVIGGACSAGFSFIIHPDGSGVGVPLSWLEHSPFSSFRIPGIILLVFNAFLPFLTLIGLFSKPSNNWFRKLNIFPEQHWSLTFSLYCGIVLNIWIVVQQMMTSYFWLQPIIAGTGILLIILSLLPWMKRAYSLHS